MVRGIEGVKDPDEVGVSGTGRVQDVHHFHSARVGGAW